MKTPTILPTLPKWGERNLTKLIEFLEKLEPKKFDFRSIVREFKKNGHTCGTVCCAIGWIPAVFPKRARWQATTGWDNEPMVVVRFKGDDGVEDLKGVAAKFFGMNFNTSEGLFVPDSQKQVHLSLRHVSERAKPRTVARMLRKYLKLTHTPQ